MLAYFDAAPSPTFLVSLNVADEPQLVASNPPTFMRCLAAGLSGWLFGCAPHPVPEPPVPLRSAPSNTVSAPADVPEAATTKNDRAIVAQISRAAAERDPMATLKELCTRFPHRRSGSPDLEGALEWARSHLERSAQENVRVQPVQVPRWVRGREALTVLPEQASLAILGLGGSVPTPLRGVEAEVAGVRDFDELRARAGEVRNRIVLFDVKMTLDAHGMPNYGELAGCRRRGPNEAAKLGAKAVLIRSLTTDPAYAEACGYQHHVAALETDSGAAPIVALSMQGERPGPSGLATPKHFDRPQAVVALLGPLGVRRAVPFFAGADVQPLLARGTPGVGFVHDLRRHFDAHHSEADRTRTVDPAALRQELAAVAATLYLLAEMPKGLGARD